MMNRIFIVLLALIFVIILGVLVFRFKKKIYKIITISLCFVFISIGTLFALGYGFSKEMTLCLNGYSKGSIKRTIFEELELDNYTFFVNINDIADAPKGDKIINGFLMYVEKIGFLYKVKHYDYNVMYKSNVDGELYGHIASFKLEDRYIHFILSTYSKVSEDKITRPLALKVVAEGKEVDVNYYCYFFTDNKITSFSLNDIEVNIYNK